MGVLTFTAEVKGGESWDFSNPYDAMTALLGTKGEADVYVVTESERSHLLHRNASGTWSEAK